MFHATFKTSFLNYKHRTTDFIAPEANDVKEVIKYLYTDEFRDFSINIFINFLNKNYNSAFYISLFCLLEKSAYQSQIYHKTHN